MILDERELTLAATIIHMHIPEGYRVLISGWNYREIDKSLFIIDQTMVPIWIPIVTARYEYENSESNVRTTFRKVIGMIFLPLKLQKEGKIDNVFILIHEDASSNVKFMFNPAEYQRNSKNYLYLLFYSFSKFDRMKLFFDLDFHNCCDIIIDLLM